MKFRKKPVVVEAIQYIGHNDAEIFAFFHNAFTRGEVLQTIFIPTSSGVHKIVPGDWVIRGVNGEFYPCKSDIFEMTYERVEEQ